MPKVIEQRKTGSQGSRVVGPLQGIGVVADVARFVATYIALPESSVLVISSWVLAAWLADKFDRFPHLAITSPEKRCGKTRLLQVIERVVPKPYNTANISPAALYRLVEKERPTLLLDEAQSVVRRASESSEIIRELFNAGIDRNARIVRCGGKNFDEIREFAIYSPKVIALIGELDGVLADRCLPIRLERKTDADEVAPYRSRMVEPLGQTLTKQIENWVADHAEEVASKYDKLEPFGIQNDRMAELLLPLQAVLTVAGASLLPVLEQFAFDVEAAEADRMSPGALLLQACREILNDKNTFISTASLLTELAGRSEEPWSHWNRNQPINGESLARLLKPYGIRPDRQQKKFKEKVVTTRGYLRSSFETAWAKYLPTPRNNPTT